MKFALIACALLAGGCILPVSTGAPLPATTVGKGHLGFALSGEAPTLDLISDNKDSDQAGSTSAVSYGAAPAAAATMTVSYGIGDDTDIEIAGEGALYFFVLPIPTGGSIGLRQHVDLGESFDMAFALKLGSVSSSASVTTGSGDSEESSARATYGSFQAVVQTKRGFIRPLLALNVMPATISRDPSDADPFKFKGVASSFTAGIHFVGRHAVFGPYLAATNFYSDRFDNSGWFVSGGLVFAIRPDRNREQPAIPPAPAYPAPMPTTGPQPAPGGPPGGPPPPPPSAPTPTTTPM